MTAPALHRRDVLLATCWVPKLYTTDPPRLVPHTTWRLEMKLVCATVIRTVLLMSDGAELAWGLEPSRPQQEVTIDASFWSREPSSSLVDIGFGSRTVVVDDELLKSNPRGEVTVVAPEKATTGEIVPLAEVGKHGLVLGVLMLDAFDCEDRRGDRWRVRPALRDVLPPHLADITSGRRYGRALVGGGTS